MRACHFELASGTFKCHFGALLWPHSLYFDENKTKQNKFKKTERVDKAYWM